MTTQTLVRAAWLAGMLVLCLSASAIYAQPDAQTSHQAVSLPDGQHDFDFNIGAWKTHISRLAHPLTGDKTWVQYSGTHVVRKVWNGQANIGVLDIDGPGGHIEALSLRLYNSQTHQWSLNFARSADGTLGVPMFGEFRHGRGEFIDQEEIGGRMILVRNIWSDITPNSCRQEWSYSSDGGKTWEVNWIAVDTRIPDTPEKSL